MWQTLKNGGLWMIPIVLSGLLATFIIVERFIYFATIKKRDSKLMQNIRMSFVKDDFDEAERNCVEASTPLSTVIRKAIKCRRLGSDDLKEIVQAEMDGVMPKYEHFLTALGTIANIATMLGLLGTVTGNIKAFGVLSGGSSDPAALAGAIAEALVTTAAGLIVGIPSVIAHNHFVKEEDRQVIELEKSVTEVMFRITGKKI